MAVRRAFKNKKLKASSKNWLKRQFNDPYVQRAQKEGYRCRAAFKLLELNDKYNFIENGQTVVDLGAAPGGWSQVLVALAGVTQDSANKIVAIDLLEMEAIPGVAFIQGDFNDEETYKHLCELVGDKKIDGVISDMAPNTIGHKQTDHLRLMNLVSLAYDFALHALKPGGYFVAKLFEGGTREDLLKSMKKNFDKVRHVKPPASRKGSSEMYVVATGFDQQKEGNT